MSRRASNSSFLLAVDKPVGPTSHDVVAQARRALGERRVGHAGTLDPAASGVLVLGVGQATRLLGHLTLDRKAYVARIVLGAETSTDDSEGEVTASAAVAPELFGERYAAQVIAALVGTVRQVPPAFSAAHVGGARAYELARRGKEVELASREVTIYGATLLGVEPLLGGRVAWTCAFEVSKGTYVRSIARDLGRELGCGGHLGALRRSASGSVTLGLCVTPDELSGPNFDPERRCLDPLVALGLARRPLSEGERREVAQGRRIVTGLVTGPDGSQRRPRSGERVALVRDGLLLGLWHEDGETLACDVNLPLGVMGVGS